MPRMAEDLDLFESTLTLLTRARAGDPAAMDDLFARQLPGLRRWASGRLPRWARSNADTQDLVQDTLVAAFKKIDGFDHRGVGALRAYLRQAVMNRIRDELRRTARRPPDLALDDQVHDAPAPGPSPFDATVDAEIAARYAAALPLLSEDDQDLVVARMELQMSYDEIAAASGKPSANAARMAVSRALLKLAEAMRGSDPLAR
jgi:RNA polymerase sigma-70 factor (ECF subfamily)